jgi:hypothetical protein
MAVAGKMNENKKELNVKSRIEVSRKIAQPKGKKRRRGNHTAKLIIEVNKQELMNRKGEEGKKKNLSIIKRRT